MKRYLFLLCFIPSILLSKENFEHKKQLMIESHLYEVKNIVQNIWRYIPEDDYMTLIYHLEELEFLLSYSESAEKT